MTEDDVSRGSHQINLFTGRPYEAVQQPSTIESIVATLPTGPDGAQEIWKLNHDDQQRDAGSDRLVPVIASRVELHNLTTDPEERYNHVEEAGTVLAQLQALLVAERQSRRRQPRHPLLGSTAS